MSMGIYDYCSTGVATQKSQGIIAGITYTTIIIIIIKYIYINRLCENRWCSCINIIQFTYTKKKLINDL